MIGQRKAILQVNSITKDFVRRGFTSRAQTVMRAVNNVSLQLFANQTYALVGESGSGKSTTGRIICALERPTSGTVVFNDENYTDFSDHLLRQKIRGNIQMVLQDPFSSLNPRKTIEHAVLEALEIQKIGKNHSERLDAVVDMIERVGLSSGMINRYPHQFSGGQLQRVNIARALVVRPKILILDESVSALDVSVQAQVLNLLQDLKQEFSLSYLFITHDLSVVRFIADRVGVLRKGELVEEGTVDEIFDHPQTDYTQNLLSSIPIPNPEHRQLAF
ncbi:MAG: ATP-binding cassette domain-containing protein [Bifidobacterium aquikefiri]|uniref:ABC transporter ATP-binding protein n=1 Tax=Bifidobacterium aquikefiri TaxID=1653207 RepID=A0A261G991_9BIFI|nr:ATP-binding cassette domain-containing protein [Bifidobacterium aquikefiri]OZG67992.1 ABC transporter ATP-binding protein [Bifidobacterium aquikefiri]